MALPIKPMISEEVLDRTAARPYTGKIEPGAVFAWEPDLPHAREIVVVTRVEHEKVWVRNIDGTPYMNGDLEVWNDEDRFRAAVIPTFFNPQTP